MKIPFINLNENRPEKGKDNRTLGQKIWGWLITLAVVYLIVVHILAGLYLTGNKLVLKVETAQTLVSPLSDK